MSETLPALDAPRPHPIRLAVTDDLRRSRLTVFFRLLLAIPHLVWLTLWSFAAGIAVVVAWIVALVTGRVPDGLHGFMAALHALLHASQRVPLDRRRPVSRASPGRRATPSTSRSRRPLPRAASPILFRLVLAIPAAIVMSVLQNVAWIVAFLAWFYALFTGRMSQGMRDLQAYCLRYQAQTYGYLLLLTQRYPSFSDE